MSVSDLTGSGDTPLGRPGADELLGSDERDERGAEMSEAELNTKVHDAVDWDDRKELADVWQKYAPLPAEGLSDGVYSALLAVARWGARNAILNEL